MPAIPGRLTVQQRRTLTRLVGLTWLVAGMLGFMPDVIQPPPAGAPPLAMPAMYGYLFDALPVNALHSSLRLILGALGLAVAGNSVAARLYARGIALLYAVFAVFGCLPALDTLFGLIPLFGYNVALHASVAAITAYIGWAPGLAPEVASRPTGRWFARVVATVVGVCVLWYGVLSLSLFHEVTWWYSGPVRPSAALMRNWIERELPPRATKAQTLAFLRSHFIGRGGGDDQYVYVYADEIDAEVDFVRYIPGCSLMLNLAFYFDRTGHLSTHRLDERPVCL